MEFLNSKNIIMVLIAIVILSAIGLGYLEIKNLKLKINSLENLIINNKPKAYIDDKPKEKPVVDNTPKLMCIICKKNEASPSSMNKYHNRYCINCATLDYSNTQKVNMYMEKNMIKEEVDIDDKVKEEIIDTTLDNISEKSKEEQPLEGSEEIVVEEQSLGGGEDIVVEEQSL